MLSTRSTLPVLALCLLLEELSAAVLPGRARDKREAGWLDQELFSHLMDGGDHLSVGDAGDVRVRNGDTAPPLSESVLAPTDHLTHQRHRQAQRKANEKRRKVAPLDPIGGFQMSTFQNRRDETNMN